MLEASWEKHATELANARLVKVYQSIDKAVSLVVNIFAYPVAARFCKTILTKKTRTEEGSTC